jgi:hypothetical protein
MTDAPEYPGQASAHPEALDVDRLAAARGVLADIAQHTTREVQAACRVILSLSDDVEEREEAEGLLRFFAARPGGETCARS